MSLQVGYKFGSFTPLMCPHRVARFRLGRFRVKSQPADTGKRLSLNRAFSFIKVPFANQQSRGRSCSPPKTKDLLSVWATPSLRPMTRKVISRNRKSCQQWHPVTDGGKICPHRNVADSSGLNYQRTCFVSRGDIWLCVLKI